MRFRADGTGKVAIYQPGTGGSDDVFDDPLVDLDRVVFHTNFPFLKIARVIEGQLEYVNLPTPPYWSYGRSTMTMPHGQAGIPAFAGVLLNYPPGKKTPWAGSVPVHTGNDLNPDGTPTLGAAFAVLLADRENIYVRYTSLGAGYFRLKFFRVYVFEQLMEE